MLEIQLKFMVGIIDFNIQLGWKKTMTVQLDLSKIVSTQDLLSQSLDIWQFPIKTNLGWQQWRQILTDDISLPSIELIGFEQMMDRAPDLLEKFLQYLSDLMNPADEFIFSLATPCRKLMEPPSRPPLLKPDHVKSLIFDHFLTVLPLGLTRIEFSLTHQNLEFEFQFDCLTHLLQALSPLLIPVSAIRGQLRWQAVGARFFLAAL